MEAEIEKELLRITRNKPYALDSKLLTYIHIAKQNIAKKKKKV
jgi:hypothetical protein